MSNSAIGQKDRPWRARISFQNGDSNPIVQGNVVSLLPSNPSKVVKAATAGAVMSGVLLAGIATRTAQPGEFLDVVVGGVAGGANVQLAVRANTTSPWPSYAAVNAGDIGSIDTVNGGINPGGAPAAGNFAYQLIILGSVPSATTQASSVGSGLVLSASLPVLVRSMV